MTEEMAVKFVGDSRDLIEGPLAPFGGPIKGRDLHGEYFTKDTDFALDWFGDWQRPLLWKHGIDDDVKTDVVGRIKVEKRPKGLWMQAQLDAASEYHEAIASLVDSGTMGLSSGSVLHLIERDRKSGEIKRWPLVEGSITPTPANPDAYTYSVKSADAIAHLAVLGVEAPDELSEPDTITLKIEADTTQAETAIASLTDAFKAFQATLTPQSLHDASVASGAKCAHEPGEAPVSEPASVLAVKAGEGVVTATEADLDELRELLRPVAQQAVKEVLRN